MWPEQHKDNKNSNLRKARVTNSKNFRLRIYVYSKANRNRTIFVTPSDNYSYSIATRIQTLTKGNKVSLDSEWKAIIPRLSLSYRLRVTT